MSDGTWKYKKLTASGIVTSKPAAFKGYLVGTDTSNDVTSFSMFNGTTNAGAEIIPTHSIDASVLGMNGVTGLNIDCPNGIYAEFTTAGAAEVIVYFIDK